MQMFKKVLRPIKFAKRKTNDKAKLRKDIKLGNVRVYSLEDAIQADRYFNFLANKRGHTNADFFVEVMRTYYQATGETVDGEKALNKNLKKKTK